MDRKNPGKWKWKSSTFFLCVISIFLSACAEIQKPEPEPFYAETAPPAKQEFRWSNGKTPKSFDPARAAAAPETDIVRALFEGLTDIDTRSLKEVPAIAEKWTSSPDRRVWTFQLRKDARWSNGKRITADNFVTSWKRLVALGDKAGHPELFQNIIGMRASRAAPLPIGDLVDFTSTFGEELQPHHEQPNSVSATKTPVINTPPANTSSNLQTENKIVTVSKPANEKFGVEALDSATLRVTLEFPDRDFPKLVANPIFRPIYGDGAEFDTTPLDADVVTNGAFTVASVGKDGIALDRSDIYWNKSAVSLERVKFVFKESAEAALSAYKKGEIDALTNAEFEPLALKILSPYDDFRQTTHSALNFYVYNTEKAPFNDRRVREALAISIDRERITDVELERTARPATSFLPLGERNNAQLTLDAQKAKYLLEDAGFAGGADFPTIRLVINRNDTQQRVARAVAKMWKQNLNLDTDIIVKELSEIDAARSLGEYDLVRRGVVLPTMDESVGMAIIFGLPKRTEAVLDPSQSAKGRELNNEKSLIKTPIENNPDDPEAEEHSELSLAKNGILNEVDAFFELNAIPLYFPLAYSLVKPYVRGFEVNGLDATSLEDISIDSSWQPKTAKGGS
ncbi:MAG: peptide ABC transporter substrate-binding protein [Chloracidobacterium sp.]|nr:peptide ABC transporter substrate-binding protein [Chloracidobacterium sp.]